MKWPELRFDFPAFIPAIADARILEVSSQAKALKRFQSQFLFRNNAEDNDDMDGDDEDYEYDWSNDDDFDYDEYVSRNHGGSSFSTNLRPMWKAVAWTLLIIGILLAALTISRA